MRSALDEAMPLRSSNRATTVDLTICTSVMPADEPFVDLNWELMTQSNDVEGWKWLVIDNSEEPELLHLRSWDARVQVVEGVETDRTLPEWCQGSYHHAGAFNKAVHAIDSRFALFLDPDFYIIRPQWMAEVTSHMQANGLAIFGAPWHPKWYTKYRYFPCAHALFIDLEQVPVDEIDFTPSVREVDEARDDHVQDRKQFWKVPPMPSRRQRRTVATSNDTGYPLYLRYADDPGTRWESVTPVFRPREEFRGPEYALSWYGRALERVLPERYSLLPKSRQSYSESGFREWGHPDVSHLGWEEFLWRGEPFGFHMRRYRNDGVDQDEAPRIVKDVLTAICESYSFDGE